jgi:hypothetical protein
MLTGSDPCMGEPNYVELARFTAVAWSRCLEAMAIAFSIVRMDKDGCRKG